MKATISEVEINGGSANATSFWIESFKPDYAFSRGNAHAGWSSSTKPKYSGIFPQMVWYDFGKGNSFVPARVTFRGEINCNTDRCKSQVPAVWEFVGSNDDVCNTSGNWTVLCQDLSDTKPQKILDTKFCDVEGVDQDQREYRCLGINVIRAHDTLTCLSNARMWKYVIQKGETKNTTRYE